MPIVKTAISLQESLFERTDDLARELALSRSQLIARALDEFLQRHESRRLLETINEAMDGEPEPGEKEILRRHRDAHAASRGTRRDSEVTKRLNDLFADRELAQEQTRTAGELDAVGTDWSDERW